MTKTIKELSEAHAPINKEDSWDKTQKQILKQTSFECGANAMLEEIDKHIRKYHFKNPFDATAIDLLDKIKELKGK